MWDEKRHVRVGILAVLIATGCGAGSVAPAPDDAGAVDGGTGGADLRPDPCAALSAQLQGALDKYVTDVGVPGSAAQVIRPGCRWEGAAGFSDTDAQTRMKPVDQAFVGSLTKTFTAVTILQLVAEGKLGLDDPVTLHVPTFTDAKDVSVRQLLNHTSGLYDYSLDATFRSAFNANLDRVWKPEELLAYAAGKPATNAIGVFHYCATNTILAGLVIEKVTGSTVAKEFRSRIIGPLKLTSTYLAGFEAAAPGTLSHGYYNGQDILAILQKSGPSTAAWTTGSMVSTVGDVSLLLEALLVKQTLLPAPQLVEMKKLVDTDAVFKDNLHVPGYGLGLVQRTTALGPGLGNGGGSPGWLSRAFYLADHQTTLVLFINTGTDDVEVPFDALVDVLAKSPSP